MSERKVYQVLERVPFMNGPWPDAVIYNMDAYSSEKAAERVAKKMKSLNPKNDYFVTPLCLHEKSHNSFMDDE